MEDIGVPSSKHIHVSMDDSQKLAHICRALSNQTRLDVLKLLAKESMISINEIAKTLNIPVSSAALAVRILEEAGLTFSENIPGTHGLLKLSTRKVDSIGISLMPTIKATESVLTIQMPIGGYSRIGNIKPTCGLAGRYSAIGEYDNPRSFYTNNRFEAQLLWFRQGFVEYVFSVLRMPEIEVLWLELSFEACSEAPIYRDPWKSDITLFINDRKIGTWTSPCDCGDHRGKLNPPWWPDLCTQHGFLKSWHIRNNGSFLDNMRISDTTLEMLDLYNKEAITVRIEVEEDAANVGGLNLFGQYFGDFDQGLVLRLGYKVQSTDND